MRIEILTFEGCPNAETTRELVQHAVKLENVDAAIELINVETADLAKQLRFLGSPSVRVDGQDVESAANDRTGYGLMCRTYATGSEFSGTPSMEMIRAAIRGRRE